MNYYKYIFILNIKLFLSLNICLSNDTSLIFEERIYDKNNELNAHYVKTKIQHMARK